MSNPFSFIEKPKEDTNGNIFDFINNPQDDCEKIPVKEEDGGLIYCQCHCGGGNGTNDYNQLLNKPSINGQTLIGDMEIESNIKIDNDTIIKNENNELSVQKTKYGLNIGPWYYDGSSEVNVEIYEGEMDINGNENKLEPAMLLSSMTTIPVQKNLLNVQSMQQIQTYNTMSYIGQEMKLKNNVQNMTLIPKNKN